MDYYKFKFLCKLLSQFYIKNVYSPETASLTWQGNKEITVWYQGSKLACIKWILTHAQYFWKIVHCVCVSFREFWYWEQNASHLVVQCIICHFGYYCIFAFARFISSCTDISCYCIFCTTSWYYVESWLNYCITVSCMNDCMMNFYFIFEWLYLWPRCTSCTLVAVVGCKGAPGEMLGVHSCVMRARKSGTTECTIIESCN